MRTVVTALRAALLLLLTASAFAQPERYLDSPTGWGYLYGATQTQINSQNGAGSRVTNLERVGTTNTYDMVVVDNGGPFAATGTVAVYNQTLAQLSNYLNANNRRILDIEVDEIAGAERFTAVTVPNSGTTAASGWGWLVRVSAQQIDDWLTDNPNLRLVDIERYTLGGTPFYSVVAIPNTGANFRPSWGYALNRTPDQITTILSGGSGSCIIDVELESPGSVLTPPRFNIIYVNSPVGAGLWWYPSLTSDQVNDALNQNGARLVTFHRWTTWSGATRWAVSMMDNANAETRRVRGILANRQSEGVYGFKVKRVGGSTIAALNDTYAFEPASTLKIAHAAALIRLASLGQVDMETVLNYQNPCDSDACPNTHFCEFGPNRNLDYILERMLRVSDNTATQYIRNLLDDGNGAFSGVNDFIASQGLSSSTGVSHDIGCFAPTEGTPSNAFTANDAVLLYERIANGSIFNTAWRDELFNDRMINWPRDRDSDGSAFISLRSLLDEEMDATDLQPNERADFLDQMRLAYKAGGYGWATKNFPETFWGSLAGWAQFPHITVLNGIRLPTQRQYTFVMYQDWATNVPGAEAVYADVMELLRTPIRDAVQSWDDACTPPAVTIVNTDVSVPEGSQVSIPTLLGGSTTSRTFQWEKFNGFVWETLSDAPGEYAGTQTGTLSILNAIPSQAGQYRCLVLNYCGIDLSPTVNVAVTPACDGDSNGDGIVNFADLNAVLASFGQSVPPGTGGDVNGDGVVDFADLNEVLTNFGVECG
ncbi:MAG: serine hydrolase [Phycisphaerales bacterium]